MHVYATFNCNFNADTPMWGKITDSCGPASKNLFLYLPASGIESLPIGGDWRATMILRGGIDARMTTISVDFRFIITDDDNIQIYLPEFGDATPTVDLNLRTKRPVSGLNTVSGHQVVDACLYDGYNTNSKRFTVRVSDPQSNSGAQIGKFFVRREGGSQVQNRIEYKVKTRMGNLGETDHGSGTPVTFENIDTAEIRAVRLPSIPFPVVCTPWPITLETPEFSQGDKNAGRYSGTLRLEFFPSTTAP